MPARLLALALALSSGTALAAAPKPGDKAAQLKKKALLDELGKIGDAPEPAMQPSLLDRAWPTELPARSCERRLLAPEGKKWRAMTLSTGPERCDLIQAPITDAVYLKLVECAEQSVARKKVPAGRLKLKHVRGQLPEEVARTGLDAELSACLREVLREALAGDVDGPLAIEFDLGGSGSARPGGP
jgi:hypothetical protein